MYAPQRLSHRHSLKAKSISSGRRQAKHVRGDKGRLGMCARCGCRALHFCGGSAPAAGPAWSSVIAECSPDTASWHGSVADTAPWLDADSQWLGMASQQLVSAAGCPTSKVFWHRAAAWLCMAAGCPTGKVSWHGVAAWLRTAAGHSTGEACQHRAPVALVRA